MANIARRIVGVSVIFGGGVLLGIVALIIFNIIARFFGYFFLGTYELVEMVIVAPVVFALPYTALKQGHVAIRILTSRLSARSQAICGIFASFICIGVLVAMVWTSIELVRERMLTEITQVLEFYVLPFRCVWAFGLILFCLVLLIDLFKTLSQGLRE